MAFLTVSTHFLSLLAHHKWSDSPVVLSAVHTGEGNVEFEWTRNSGSTRTQTTGPTYDHTLNNVNGQFNFHESIDTTTLFQQCYKKTLQSVANYIYVFAWQDFTCTRKGRIEPLETTPSWWPPPPTRLELRSAAERFLFIRTWKLQNEQQHFSFVCCTVGNQKKTEIFWDLLVLKEDKNKRFKNNEENSSHVCRNAWHFGTTCTVLASAVWSFPLEPSTTAGRSGGKQV